LGGEGMAVFFFFFSLSPFHGENNRMKTSEKIRQRPHRLALENTHETEKQNG
jgi:hypothetical protein